MKKENVLVELLAGILAFGIAMQIIALVVFERDLYNAVGLWTGIGVAVFMAIHMKRSLEDAIGNRFQGRLLGCPRQGPLV